jgi:hypothetical protein
MIIHTVLASLLSISLLATSSPAVAEKGKEKPEQHQEKAKKNKAHKTGAAKQEAVDQLVKELGLKNRGQLHKLLGGLNSTDITTITASDIPISKLKQRVTEGDKSEETVDQIRKLNRAATNLLGTEPATSEEIAQSVADVLELLKN